MSTPTLSIQQFAARLRGKYPGTYDDLSDSDLTGKVLAKYPEYGDMVQPGGGPETQPAQAVGGAPMVDDFGRTLDTSSPTPDTPQSAPTEGVISRTPSSLIDYLRRPIANSAIGYSLQQTMPKVAEATGLTPTDTVYNPDYAAHKEQLLAPENLIPDDQHGAVANLARGALKGAGSLTSGSSMATMAGAAATGGLAGPAIPALGQLISAAFGTQVASDLAQQAPDLYRRWNAGDTEGAFEQLGRMGFDAVMLKQMVEHAAGGRTVTPADMATDRGVMGFGEQAAQKQGLPFIANQALPKTMGAQAPQEAPQATPEPVQAPPTAQSVTKPESAGPRAQQGVYSSALPFLRPRPQAGAIPSDNVEPSQQSTEAEPALAPGPGAKTAGGRETPGSNLADLTQSLDAVTSPKQSPIERMQTAAAMAQKQIANIPQRLSEAVSSVESGMQGLWDAYRKPPPWTDLRSSLGKWQGATQYSAWELEQFSRALKESVPDKTRREALTNWIQAGGNEALLRERAAKVSPDLQPGYKAALTLNETERTLASNIRGYLDAQLEEAQKAGMLAGGVENYVSQVWAKDPKNPIAQKLMAEVGASELLAKPFFAKQRVFESYFEGEDAGFRPKDKDVGALLSAYHQSFAKQVAARGFVKQLLEGKASDGRPLVATAGQGRTLTENELSEGSSAYFIRANTKPKDVFDYRSHDDPSLRRWKWVAEDSAGKPIYVEGDLLIHPEAYAHLKNVLSDSAIRKNPLGKAALKSSSEFKNTMLSLSAFHQTQIGLHATEHMVNPLKVPKLDLNEPLQRSLVDHGLQVASFDAEEAFGEGVHGGGLINKLPVLGQRFQDYNHYLFHDYIPRLKMEMAKHAFDRNTERYSGKLSQDQILELTAKQANAAFGELNYTMMGRNKTLQDVLRLGLLAPDFLEARAKFVGQALKPYGAEQSSALIRGALVMYTGARIANQLLNGDPDWDPAHAFTIRVGNRSFGLRTVQGDLLHLLTDPRSFAYNRLNPLITKPAIEGILGRDQYGRQRNAVQQLRDIALGAIPIPFQGLTKQGDADWKATAMAATGVAGYKYRTKAERMAQEFINKGGGFDDSHRSDAERNAMAQYRQQIEKQSFKPNAVWNDVRAGKLTKKDAEALVKESKSSRLVRDAGRLSLEQTLQVWDAANDAERQTLRPVLISKGKQIQNRLPAERQDLQGQLRSALQGQRTSKLPAFLQR